MNTKSFHHFWLIEKDGKPIMRKGKLMLSCARTQRIGSKVFAIDAVILTIKGSR